MTKINLIERKGTAEETAILLLQILDLVTEKDYVVTTRLDPSMEDAKVNISFIGEEVYFPTVFVGRKNRTLAEELDRSIILSGGSSARKLMKDLRNEALNRGL